MVLDEAQAIKNPAARQTRTVKRLRADARIVLTGTPVENRLSRPLVAFRFSLPGPAGLAGDSSRSSSRRSNAREENRYAPLRALVQPYILRRLKTDKRVIADLPDKTEVRAFCGLAQRQAALYAKLVEELADAARGLDGMKRRGLVAGLPDALQAVV